MDISQLKKEAGVKACQMVENGMTLGVGTGSTVAYFIEELGRRHREEGLEAHCVPTSIRSAQALKKCGMEEIEALGKVFNPNEHEAITQVPTNDFEPDRNPQ